MLQRYAGGDLLCIHVVSVFLDQLEVGGDGLWKTGRGPRDLEEENRVMRREMEKIREN